MVCIAGQVALDKDGQLVGKGQMIFRVTTHHNLQRLPGDQITHLRPLIERQHSSMQEFVSRAVAHTQSSSSAQRRSRRKT